MADAVVVAIAKLVIADLASAAGTFETSGWSPKGSHVVEYNLEEKEGQLAVTITPMAWSNPPDALSGASAEQVHNIAVVVQQKLRDDWEHPNTLLRLVEQIVDRYEPGARKGPNSEYIVISSEPLQDPRSVVPENLFDLRLFTSVCRLAFKVFP